MQMGICQVDLAILLPAFAAAWNLVGGQTMFAAQKNSGCVYLSPDGLFAVEAPAGWELCKQEGSNEVTFLNGEVSASVAAVETEAGSAGMLKDKFAEGRYMDVAGLCKVAHIAEIEAQGWSLNPGRYVGVTERGADEFIFAERLEELNEELETLNGDARELEERIAGNVVKLLEGE